MKNLTKQFLAAVRKVLTYEVISSRRRSSNEKRKSTKVRKSVSASRKRKPRKKVK